MVNISRTNPPTGKGTEPKDERCALERFPHIAKKLCLLWEYPEFDSFCSHLLMDSRDGKRQGLPWEAAEEILFLADFRVTKRAVIASEVTGRPFAEIYEKMVANAEAAQREQSAVWNDPLSNTEIGRNRFDKAHGTQSGEAQPKAQGQKKKKSWLAKLIG